MSTEKTLTEQTAEELLIHRDLKVRLTRILGRHIRTLDKDRTDRVFVEMVIERFYKEHRAHIVDVGE